MKWHSEERAQASLEYVLLLIILVVLIITISKSFLIPFYKKASDVLQNVMQNAFRGERLHNFPMRK